MTRLRLEISEAAASDILEQSDWYGSLASQELAAAWERSVTETVLRILDYPHAAPICSFSKPELAEIRRVPVNGFPRHLVFYRVTENGILIVRVLHGARDLESLFS